MIAVDGVTVRYTDGASGAAHDALRGVSLAIAKGESLALVGPSGCGKSTLLRAMIGLVRPSEGTVRVDGADPALTLSVRRRIGYVIQEGALFPHLSARDNAALAVRALDERWDRARIDARIDTLARMVRLDADVLARFPSQLSGGQRQRAAIMRALMLDPEVLLLDEPLGALDTLVRADLHEELRALFLELEKTVVFVTHDLAEAGHFAQSIALMKDGAVVARGTLAELRASSDAFVARFFAAQRGVA